MKYKAYAVGITVTAMVAFPVITAISAPPDPVILINPGKAEETVKYYEKVVGKRLGLSLVVGNKINTSFTLDNLIAFAGYSDAAAVGLRASDMNSQPSPILMDPEALAASVSNGPTYAAFFKGEWVKSADPAKRDLLAVSFFAPKICDVGSLTKAGDKDAPPDYGFRKLVLLKPRPGSDAQKKQVRGIWILFNYFVNADALKARPLNLGSSVNTQVMITFDQKQDGGNNAAYWLDFDRADAGSKLNDRLPATFDSGRIDKRDYFVPTACAQCHGGGQDVATLNPLDTDHWFERVDRATPAGIDFPDFADSKLSVLIDAPDGENSPAHKAIFDDFRQMNLLMRPQILMSEANLQLQSVDQWIEKHTARDTRLRLSERALIASGKAWEEKDAALLGHFDRYCYRCHNGINYNVFDKLSVIAERDQKELIQRLSAGPSRADYGMPQDRAIELKIVVTIQDLVRAAK